MMKKHYILFNLIMLGTSSSFTILPSSTSSTSSTVSTSRIKTNHNHEFKSSTTLTATKQKSSLNNPLTPTYSKKSWIQFLSSLSLFAFALLDTNTNTNTNTNVPTNHISSIANAAVIQSQYCASGLGEGCDQLNEGNEFIKSLQQKSLKNKEKYQKEALAAYNMKNYPDFFASLSPPKYLVMNTDGVTFQVFTEQELTQLKQEGKIAVQMPKAMNGKVTDVTQKPIMMFKE